MGRRPRKGDGHEGPEATLFLILGVLAGRVTAETLEVPASVDTFVTTAGLDSTYSNLPYPIVGRGGGTAPARSRSLLGFGELNGVLPPDAQVESAVLRRYQDVTAAAAKEIEVYRITEFWSATHVHLEQDARCPGFSRRPGTPGASEGWKRSTSRRP